MFFSSKRLALTVMTMFFAGVTFAQTPDIKPERIRGEIVSLNGDTMKVLRRNGETVSIELKSDVTVSALKALSLSDIKPGSFIGTAAMTGTDGKLMAMEVMVFPESARGTGEGHREWDQGPNSSMTNANVDAVVDGVEGRDIKLSYKGGNTTVTVSANTPVVTTAPAMRSDLLPGKKVFVTAMPAQQGGYTAQRVVVEKNGVVPPM